LLSLILRSVSSVLSSTWRLVHLPHSEVRGALRTSTSALGRSSRDSVLVHSLLLHHNLVRSFAAINVVVVDVVVIDDIRYVTSDLLHVRVWLLTLSIASGPSSLAFVFFLISHGRFILDYEALLRVRLLG
jgi:hypothetical protein